jgi:DNA-binding NtrC family response regulator
MRKRRILIVDDERSVRNSLKEWFLEDGFQAETAEDGPHALQAMDEGPFDIYIVDLKMPGMDGVTLLNHIREGDKEAAVIILTAYASVETAVDALKQGAFDYVTKPVDPDELSNLVRNALRQKELQEENQKLKQQVSEMVGATPLVGESAAMKRILEMIRTVAETDSTVVILGESGTGKEIIARTIHAQSKRRFAPMVAVNCGAIPETLLESELFGHEKGAFTGAQYRRKGKIELAHGGTLFLDEIGDITPKMQIDLLRVLENRTFTRLGGNKEIHSDFRLVCATNQNLEKLVEEGRFRRHEPESGEAGGGGQVPGGPLLPHQGFQPGDSSPPGTCGRHPSSGQAFRGQVRPLHGKGREGDFPGCVPDAGDVPLARKRPGAGERHGTGHGSRSG